MARDLSDQALNLIIDALGKNWVGYQENLRLRNESYLRTVAPPFDPVLGEHDQWPHAPRPEDAGHERASFNEAQATVDVWSALEANQFPTVRWIDDFIPTPAPSLDPVEQSQRETTYRASRLVVRQVSTMREQALGWYLRRAHMDQHWYRLMHRKNTYGHAWLRVLPDVQRATFNVKSVLDPSTVYPVWSEHGERVPESILVCYRKSARLAAAQYPQAGLRVLPTGEVANDIALYLPTTGIPSVRNLEDRTLVWIEDYWTIDPEWESDAAEGSDPVRSVVVNATRVNGKIVRVDRYPGWKALPYFLAINPTERDDNLGRSDVGDIQAIQGALNRLLSAEQDVIVGASRPRFKFRGDAGRTINLKGDEVVSLDPDEDIEQIAVGINVFPTQAHNAMLRQTQARITGLPSTVWGEITSAQNSGRALATAWQATAARLVPRNISNAETATQIVNFMLDIMELYDWSGARDLYGGDGTRRGNRDFDFDFPNQQPQDPNAVTLDAINKLQAGIIDLTEAMELTGETSPDEMLERVRADYMDAVLHPDKAQAYRMLQRLDQQIAIEAQQAGLQAQAAQLRMAQLASSAPGGAPSGGGPGGAGSVEQQAAAARQAQIQAAQQAAPTRTQDQNAPETQAGMLANQGSPENTVSTMVQNGRVSNRMIAQSKGAF